MTRTATTNKITRLVLLIILTYIAGLLLAQINIALHSTVFIIERGIRRTVAAVLLLWISVRLLLVQRGRGGVLRLAGVVLSRDG